MELVDRSCISLDSSRTSKTSSFNTMGLCMNQRTQPTRLSPLSIPPLRGWLRLVRITKEDLVKDMVILFGGLRFRHMDLFEVSCSQLLLNECAGTLETLRLYPTDAHGEKFPKVEEGELKGAICSEPPRPAWFRSVTEQVPTDARDHCTFDEFLIPHGVELP